MTERISIADYQRLFQEPTKKGVIHEKPKTDYKRIFLDQLKFAGIPDPQVEKTFHPTRKWRFDFCWPNVLIAVEYQGIYGKNKTGHQAVQFLNRDYEKAIEAQLLGWLYIPITAKTVGDGKALQWVERAFQLREGKLNNEIR